MPAARSDVALRCPYCRAELDEGLFKLCEGCSTLYHHACAQELKCCATFGCKRRISEGLQLQVTGRARKRFDAQTLLHAVFAAAFLPLFGVIAWLLFSHGMIAAGVIFLTLVALVAAGVWVLPKTRVCLHFSDRNYFCNR